MRKTGPKRQKELDIQKAWGDLEGCVIVGSEGPWRRCSGVGSND